MKIMCKMHNFFVSPMINPYICNKKLQNADEDAT